MSDGMRRQPSDFSPLAVAAIKAGEQGATIEDILDRLAAALERDVTMRRKIVTALMYPAVVTLTVIAVAVLVLTTTVPTFASMYEQLRVPMPSLLQALVFLSALLRAPGVLFESCAAAFLSAAAVTMWTKTARGSELLDELRFALPVAGVLARKATIARIARLLGMLLGCGVSGHSAIPIVAQATLSPRFQRSLERLQLSLTEGSSIADSLRSSGLYFPLFLHLVRVGEETGKISDTLGRAASHYELDVESALQQLGTLLEPAMILVLGSVVGGIAAAIFIPLYSLIGSMK